ncbi:MAG: HpaII family restriction endonuclease [Sphingobacteriales bacterium]|nr:MAG: HpaII family restriction endonuclease [Sphingobacteriales bacterium]
MKTGNKGEWSELYVFFKVLADKVLFPGDANLNIRRGHFYPVVEVQRKEGGVDKTYTLTPAHVVVDKNGPAPRTVQYASFKAEAAHLLNAIKIGSSTFSVPQAETFLNSIGGRQIKADSTSKADIIIQVHDSRTNLQPILGFSIKSKLGSASTLLNAGHTTNFVFKINGPALSAFDITSINSISTVNKVRDRVNAIINRGSTLEYKKCENTTFNNNLILIDSSLPLILANALQLFNENGLSAMPLLSIRLEANNPIGFDQGQNHKFYELKIKRFLSDVALGMMPNKVWSGKYNGTEGYIVVKNDGELVCYHIIEKNLFEDYLLANTKLETASTTRHGFGMIYQVGTEYFFNLNLQIRFI